MHQRSRPALHVSLSSFGQPLRINLSGMHVGDICFECESRVEIIHASDGVLLAWCACSWPEDHHLMEIEWGEN
jgi:hypothetical protein